MSSLRLALKQSLQETGHMAPKDKKKKSNKNKNNNIAREHQPRTTPTTPNHNSSNNNQQQQQQPSSPVRRRKRQPNDPPRKRGRPRKYPRPEDLEGQDQQSQAPERSEKQTSRSRSRPSDDDDEDGEHHHHSDDNSFSSENEFSYESEDSQDEEDDDDEEEDGEDDDVEDDEEEDDEEEQQHQTKQDRMDTSPVTTSVPKEVKAVAAEADEDGEVHEDEETSMGDDSHTAKKRSKKIKRLAAAAAGAAAVATSSSETKGCIEATSSDDDYKKQKKLKKESAAKKIQSQWKQRNRDSSGGSHSPQDQHEEEGSHDHPTSESQASAVYSDATKKLTPRKEKETTGSSGTATTSASATSAKKKRRDRNDSNSNSSNKNNGSSGRSKTVPSPAPAILEWAQSLSEKKWRRYIGSGMRVKVRFATKVKKEGKVIKKKKWYGGLVSAVSKDGSKIRIKYDDGTMEVSKFPDKDIVVDDEYNGEHLTNADKFLPPSPAPSKKVLDDETGHEMEIALADTPAAPQEVAVESTTVREEQVSMITSSSENRALEVQSPHSLAVRRGTMVEEVEEAAGPQSVADPEKPRLTVVTDKPAEMQLERSEAPSPTPERTVVEFAAAATDESQVIRLTPVAVVPVISQTLNKNDPPLGSKERIVRMSALGLASPEEGELSPGFTFSKDASSQRISFKPVEMTSQGHETSEMTKPVPELSATEDVALPDLSLIANTQSAVPLEDSNQEEESATSIEEKIVEKAPKLSLTIRIPNIKAEALDSAAKKREEAAPLMAEDSEVSSDDDETFCEEPLNEEEGLVTESLLPAAGGEIQRPAPSRKRPFRDSPAAGEEAPPPKKRIHLKNLDRVETPIEKRDLGQDSTFDEAAIMGTLLTLRGGLVTNDSVQSKQEAKIASEEPLEVPPPEFSEPPSEKPNREVNKISITLRRPSFEPELGEIDAAPPSHPLKIKRKKDLSERAVSPIPRANSPHARATSPKPRNARRSPGNTRRSPVTLRSDSPAPMSAEPKAVVEASKLLSKPVSKPATMIATTLGMDDPTSNEKRSLVLTGSKNSAFERKQPIGFSKDEDEDETQVSETGSTMLVDGDLAAVEGKLTSPKLRDRSKASDDSQPAVRSGRRAAQQAKDKLNNKQDAPGMEGKKKKKRRRKDGKESGDEGESENSEDDRQWVQCDSCGKWRILPSRVKVSSLPKHWYCDMNTYDPKRNNCEAPEQTAKQVAKERKRAKKRARQRLEQAELEGIPEETKKEKRVRMEAAKEAPSIALNIPRIKDESPPQEMNAVPGEREPKNKAKRLSPAPEVLKEEAQPSDSGSEQQKDEKKALGGKKSKTMPKEEKLPEVEVAEVMAETVVEAPKVKPGRRRGRPRNPTKESRGSGQESKDEGENVEWVQCEKCEKWRKLPSHICADELPDVWYCSLNTWNTDSASCESPEDKADALHQDVGNGSAVPGNPGKFSYRGLIFGTVRKHNRPMSERTRATESLFAKPVDDADNPYPVVMYAKSSAFLPRTSNFTKGNPVEEKCIGIFDIMSNSELWAELRGVGQPMTILSGGGEQPNKMHYTYDSLPDDVQKTMSELILHALGSATLTGDQVLSLTQCRQWENVPPAWLELRNFCTEDIVVNTLLQLVRDGVVEMTCSREADRAMSEWVPKYRLVRSRRRTEIDDAMKSSRCMKIAKPWKQRESDSQWISGGM